MKLGFASRHSYMHWKVCEFILKVTVYKTKTYKQKTSVTLFGVPFFSAVEVSGSVRRVMASFKTRKCDVVCRILVMPCDVFWSLLLMYNINNTYPRGNSIILTAYITLSGGYTFAVSFGQFWLVLKLAETPGRCNRRRVDFARARVHLKGNHCI